MISSGCLASSPRIVRAAVLSAAFGISFGCSPPVDPLARGGTHYQVDFPSTPAVQAEGTCNATAIGGLGSESAGSDGTRPGPPDLPVAGSEQPPSNLGTPVVDSKKASGGGRYEVSCSVQSQDGSYSIRAELEGPNTSDFAPPEGGLARLIVQGSIDSATGLGSGNVTVSTVTTQTVSPNDPCELRALTDPSDSEEFLLEPGEATFTFVCKNTTGSLLQSSRCETRGTVVLRTCSD